MPIGLKRLKESINNIILISLLYNNCSRDTRIDLLEITTLSVTMYTVKNEGTTSAFFRV